MLTEEMFKQRAPANGDILYRALKNLLDNEKGTLLNYWNFYGHGFFESVCIEVSVNHKSSH